MVRESLGYINVEVDEVDAVVLLLLRAFSEGCAFWSSEAMQKGVVVVG